MASGASAFGPADLQNLKDSKRCLLCDLSGAELRGADLSGADLSGADLSGAELRGADLRGADPRGAEMKGIRLCNTMMPDGSITDSGC